jgi:DNA-binding transcriptional LysR family regulator
MHDLNDMVYFAEVVEHGGFAAAGRALSIPRTRLSRRIAELEEQLGEQLLQRSTRSLSLTHAGEIYLRHCIAMRDTANAAVEAISQVQTEPRGLIRISCPVTLAQSTIGNLLPLFMRRYPLIKIEMRVVNRPVDPVEEGIDIALRVRAQIEDSATLVAKKLEMTGQILVAHPDLLKQQVPIKSPADLGRLDTLAMSVMDGKSHWKLIDQNGKSYTHTHTPKYIADDLFTLYLATLSGTGAALLPDYMCHSDIAAGRLVAVLPEWAPPDGIVHAVFPARRALVPAIRLLLDFFAEHFTAASREPVILPAQYALA